MSSSAIVHARIRLAFLIDLSTTLMFAPLQEKRNTIFAQSRLRDSRIQMVLVLTIFALILRVDFWTPMHSDDYFYLLKGISLRATIWHYETWSGRLVADFLSSAVLGFRSHAFSAVFNALAFVALIGAVWWVPRFGERSRSGHRSLAILLLFCTYWLGNAALGQTSFAIVGSANYLWTNVLQCLFIGLFLREAHAPAGSSPLRTALTTLLALAAGCTNENTSITTLMLICSYAAFIAFYRGPRNPKLWLYIAAFAAGGLLLILSPGNAKRLVYFSEWTTLTLAQQLKEHFLHRVSTAMGRIWPAIAILLLLVNLRPALSQDSRRHVALFAAAAFISLVVFLPSPAMPRRALNGTLVYVLVAISFVLAGWNGRSGFARRGLYAATAVLGVCFVVSYTLICLSYSDVSRQAINRDQLIRTAIARGDKTIVVPRFHFGTLLRPYSDKLDNFFAGNYVARYYGTSATIDQREQARARR